MTTKVMVSFPDEFLAEVDRVAQEEHRSRSELIREALRLYIGLRPAPRHPAGEPVALQDRIARLVPPGGEDGTADVPLMREASDGAYQTLTDQDRRIVRELQRQLAKAAPLRDIRVFGSRARGDAAPDSDLDVFIELEEVTHELRQRISEIAWEVGFQWDRVITTVVATRDGLEHGAMGANPLVLNVEREGIRP
jgi:predicted nucleotidyltransferase